jgi:hypothetical protein
VTEESRTLIGKADQPGQPGNSLLEKIKLWADTIKAIGDAILVWAQIAALIGVAVLGVTGGVVFADAIKKLAGVS